MCTSRISSSTNFSLIYINEFNSKHEDTDLILYADDTTIVTGIKNNGLCKNHQLTLEQTSDWIKGNRILLSAKKRKIILIIVNVIFVFRNQMIESLEDFKYFRFCY